MISFNWLQFVHWLWMCEKKTITSDMAVCVSVEENTSASTKQNMLGVQVIACAAALLLDMLMSTLPKAKRYDANVRDYDTPLSSCQHNNIMVSRCYSSIWIND